MISKYLTDIGVKEDSVPWNWNPDDSRQEYWKEDRETYGFDERDTWALDRTLALLIYPRLRMYNEVNKINTSFHMFEANGETLTQQQCMDKILKGFKNYITCQEVPYSEEEDSVYKEYTNCFMLLGKIIGSLWW